MTFQIQPTLMNEIEEAQKKDPRLQKFKAQVEAGLRTNVRIHSYSALYFGNKSVYHKESLTENFGRGTQFSLFHTSRRN